MRSLLDQWEVVQVPKNRTRMRVSRVSPKIKSLTFPTYHTQPVSNLAQTSESLSIVKAYTPCCAIFPVSQKPMNAHSLAKYYSEYPHDVQAYALISQKCS
ncbi:hypothetical protein SAY87_015754 [Trapa incisa]|uniref:Uncharacterized protein n=1 Tax=Trapa incisa TaxID=236973 RepID=A0AAN7LB65_9MYRT|nr:hypothetical protein SAY87_015754 [Trapa incisa]